MKPVKCNFKNVTANDKIEFKKSRCLLTISVGQESHENERFIATMKLIDASFSSCLISLHDTLQRHTIAINQDHDAEFFHDTAKIFGDKWLERNKKHYESIADRLVIIRWDDWLNMPEFPDKRNSIVLETNRDKKYKELFDASINEYLNRYIKRLKRPDLFDRGRAERVCFDYLVEECAVLCLWPKLSCQFEIYAGTHNAAIEETRERFVHSGFPELVRPVSIGFNHRPDLKPQQFEINNIEREVNNEAMRE